MAFVVDPDRGANTGVTLYEAEGVMIPEAYVTQQDCRERRETCPTHVVVDGKHGLGDQMAELAKEVHGLHNSIVRFEVIMGLAMTVIGGAILKLLFP